MSPGAESVVLRELAPRLVGKTIAFLAVTPRHWEGDFGVCECWAHFTDGSAVRLIPAFAEETVDFFPEGLTREPVSRHTVVNDCPILGKSVAGVVVTPALFSFGILLEGDTVLCLDSRPGIHGSYLSPCAGELREMIEEDFLLLIE